MKLVQAGRHLLNLDFLIRHEVNDGTVDPAELPKGIVRIVMQPGTIIDLSGPAAEAYMRAVDEVRGIDSPPGIITASRPTRSTTRQRVNPSATPSKRKKGS